MSNRRYRRRHRLNAVRIFVVTVLLLVLLGFIVTERGRSLEAEQERQGQNVSMVDEDKNSEREEIIKQIHQDETRYP